jgi:hypothetical protein
LRPVPPITAIWTGAVQGLRDVLDTGGGRVKWWGCGQT